MAPSSLFAKIFLGFWVITIAVLGSWLLAGHYFDALLPDADSPRRGDGPPRVVMRLLYDLQNQPATQLGQVLLEIQKEHPVQAYLLDVKGADILGRPVPDEVATIASRLDAGGRRAVLRDGGRHLIAHRIYRQDLGHMRSILVFKPNRSRLLNALGSNLWLRATVAVLVSGLLCFLLSRLLTRRLSYLRHAASTLAEGDLAARVAVRDRGGDETDALARDFNRMASQLQQRIASQRRLLTDVSHELRSPLARMRVALALAEQDPAAAMRHLQRIDREATRLDELIAQLLSSQRDAPAMDEHIDLLPLLREVCADASFEGTEKGCAVQLLCASEQALVRGNREQLRKALDNVLRNAIYYSQSGGDVSVRLSVNTEDIGIAVQDRGPGVPEADLPRIFDAFYRVDCARARDTGGHGLGLAIARQAILQHGGSISARNTHPGLCIDITLPLAQDLSTE